MTKKDYELIATSFKEQRSEEIFKKGIFGGSYVNYKHIIAMTAQRLAKQLQKENQRFDINRFLNACDCAPKNPGGTTQLM